MEWVVGGTLVLIATLVVLASRRSRIPEKPPRRGFDLAEYEREQRAKQKANRFLVHITGGGLSQSTSYGDVRHGGVYWQSLAEALQKHSNGAIAVEGGSVPRDIKPGTEFYLRIGAPKPQGLKEVSVRINRPGGGALVIRTAAPPDKWEWKGLEQATITDDEGVVVMRGQGFERPLIWRKERAEITVVLDDSARVEELQAQKEHERRLADIKRGTEIKEARLRHAEVDVKHAAHEAALREHRGQISERDWQIEHVEGLEKTRNGLVEEEIQSKADGKPTQKVAETIRAYDAVIKHEQARLDAMG